MSGSPQPDILISPVDTSDAVKSLNLGHCIKLTSQNFTAWNFQMSKIFFGLSLLGYLDGSTPSPSKTIVTDDKTEAPNPAYETWLKQDSMILAALMGTLSADQQYLLVRCSTAKEAWDTLSHTYANPSRPHILALKETFDLIHGDDIFRVKDMTQVFKKDDRHHLGRRELMKNTLRKAAHALKRIIELRLTEEEARQLSFFIDEPSAPDLHWGMFIPAIKGQGTEEQQRKWLPLSYSMQILGCYAQTEIGHGSNVQGLETTSTFDHVTDEFVLHSPTLTSIKWWPGGLGKVSTHAIVYARLIIDGQQHGIHGFIVQLRSLDDHQPLPGITIGDIGMKFGNGSLNAMDNGFLRLDHVRVPRDHMLMRVVQVTREGKVVELGVPRQVIYSTMVLVRQIIVNDASSFLSRAVCIATRYCAVRRQFGSRNGVETQVIDYRTQQSRLFPLLASAYAFKIVGEWLTWLYNDVNERLQAKDYSTLPEVHACTAGLKSVTTTTTSDGIEECRKMCGGHGYLVSSGLPELFATYVSACTYEGDNVVLLLQVARFLMKTVSGLGSSNPLPGTIAYMARADHLSQSRCTVQKAEDWLNFDVVIEAFEARSVRMSLACAQNLSRFSNQDEGFLELSAKLLGPAVAHCQLIVVSKFIDKLQQDIPGDGVKEQLQTLCSIYALSLVNKHLSDFLATEYITPEQGSLVEDILRSLCSKVRPNAIALVDAFNYTDHFLGSTLGRYDGNIYPKLYEEAMKDPMNQTEVLDGYEEYLRPILKLQHRGSRL